VCFLYLKNYYYSDGSGSNECTYRFDFLKYDFIISMDMQVLAFVHCIFSTHQHLGIFCTMLHNSSRSPIWYNMFQHQYKHNCELPHPRDHVISYNSMQDQNFIFEQVGKKQVYCFQTL
jgi:hypothetical protein